MATLTHRGSELLDQTPVALPLGLHRQRDTPLHQRIRQMILKAKQEEYDGYESFEDADDFTVEDDPSSFDTSTPYEEHFDHITGESKFPEQERLKAKLKEMTEFQEYIKWREAEKKKQAAGREQAMPATDPAEPPQAETE